MTPRVAYLLQTFPRYSETFILNEMLAVCPKPKEQLSIYAPRIETVQIKPSKIAVVIGPGGKQIRSIIEETGVAIDINDDGSSIYTTKPTIPSGSQEITSNAFSTVVLFEGSVITLDVDQVGSGYPGKDLVVELYLEEE